MLDEKVDQLEPKIERLLTRFRVPPDDAQQILDEIMLAMLTKRERIRDPERWLLRTLKNRCVMYWQNRRRRLYRILDSGLLTILTSRQVPEAEKEALRGELGSLLEGLRPGCRTLLTRRYGLGEASQRIDPEPWRAEDDGDELMRCLGALTRRFLLGAPRTRTPVTELLARFSDDLSLEEL